MIRGLVFDFDGLIVDTETPEFQSWHDLFATYGYTLDQSRWSSIIGTGWDAFHPLAELERLAGTALDRPALEAFRSARVQELLSHQPLLPGVLDWLDEAQQLGIPVGVASSSPRAWVLGHLTRYGLVERFDAVSCLEDAGVPKPEPTVYLKCLEALGIQSQEALALEDSFNGVTAAKRAGMYCVAVPNGMTRHMAFDAADLVLGSLADRRLTTVLSELSSRR